MNSRFILILIVLLGAFLRLFLISSNPPSLTWDEVSWGYNAYSIGIDGKDEFGKTPLVYLESFGDYKPPIYAYLTVPFVKILGLSEFSVRLPSAILGTLTLFFVYLLTKKIFFKLDNKQKEIIALLSAFVLAISPWHILLSRAAFEANVASFFIVFGIYLFLVSLERKWILVFSAISFVISMYTFNTARVFIPLLTIFLFIKFYKTLLRKMLPQTIFSILIGGIIFLPLMLFMMTPQAKLRFAEVNIFTDPGIVIESNRQVENDGGAAWSKIIHNRRIGYSLSYIKHYFDNFDPRFLFIKGDGNPKFSIQSVGQMYVWEIPFFVVGVLYLFRRKDGYYWLIPVWIILGIIPAATARETPHALRIETIIPTFQILTAYGILNIFLELRKVKFQKLNKLFVVGLSMIVIFNLFYFLHIYFRHYPKEYSSEWQYGYKNAIAYAEQNKSNYKKIIFTEDLGRPYAYVLFYSEYPPDKFRQEAKIEREALGFVHVRSFGKYIFTDDVASASADAKTLYVDVPTKIPEGVTKLKEFKLLNGITALTAYEK